ncbi:SRPBCC family protein [Streptomyces sp. NPDC048018]|uniref:SRPBCC family protein n=1 Tax=Streptomyces sp. NPDC048018 TaxID=3365499 RepID=UPI0037193DEF
MPESAFAKMKSDVIASPATERLKEELQQYLRARAEHTVTRLGSRLGDSIAKLGEPGAAASGGLKGLSKSAQALAEGKGPGQAAVTGAVTHLKESVKDKVKGLFGKGRKSGGGKSKSVTIVEDIDVGVPVREAYDQWTQFQEFSTFAKGVVSVEKADDTTSNWKVKVAKSTRSWKANVTEQVPDERITWTTEGAKGTVKGVVTFHAVTDDLTRVLLVLEYFPKGLFEKTGNLWRAQGRRARLDLKLFRKFIMLRGEATDGWRGEIRDGAVVVGHDEAVEQEQAENDEAYDEDDGSRDARGEDGPAEEPDDGAYPDEDEQEQDLADDEDPYDEAPAAETESAEDEFTEEEPEDDYEDEYDEDEAGEREPDGQEPDEYLDEKDEPADAPGDEEQDQPTRRPSRRRRTASA